MDLLGTFLKWSLFEWWKSPNLGDEIPTTHQLSFMKMGLIKPIVDKATWWHEIIITELVQHYTWAKQHHAGQWLLAPSYDYRKKYQILIPPFGDKLFIHVSQETNERRDQNIRSGSLGVGEKKRELMNYIESKSERFAQVYFNLQVFCSAIFDRMNIIILRQHQQRNLFFSVFATLMKSHKIDNVPVTGAAFVLSRPCSEDLWDHSETYMIVY